MLSVEITSNCLPYFVIYIYLFHKDGLMQVFEHKMAKTSCRDLWLQQTMTSFLEALHNKLQKLYFLTQSL